MMEAFEKKWKDWDCSVNCDIEKGCDRCEKISRHWYRAALEWVLTRECDDSIPSCEIEKELEE